MTTFTSYIVTATAQDGTVLYFMDDENDSYLTTDPADGQIIPNHADARRRAIGWMEMQEAGALEGYTIGYAEVEMKVIL